MEAGGHLGTAFEALGQFAVFDVDPLAVNDALQIVAQIADQTNIRRFEEVLPLMLEAPAPTNASRSSVALHLHLHPLPAAV